MFDDFEDDSCNFNIPTSNLGFEHISPKTAKGLDHQYSRMSQGKTLNLHPTPQPMNKNKSTGSHSQVTKAQADDNKDDFELL